MIFGTMLRSSARALFFILAHGTVMITVAQTTETGSTVPGAGTIPVAAMLPEEGSGKPVPSEPEPISGYLSTRPEHLLADPEREPQTEPLFLAPNAFTPDGDGLNDKYFPRYAGLSFANYLFQVFDRWGRLVFSTTSPGEGWDGSMGLGGAILPQGVYVWRLSAQPANGAETLQHLGSVTLIK